MRLLFWIVALAVAAAATAFALSNAASVRLDFWPLGASIEWPAYAVVFASAFVGFALGVIAASVSGLKARWAARRSGRALETAERELARVRASAEPAAVDRPRLPVAADSA